MAATCGPTFILKLFTPFAGDREDILEVVTFNFSFRLSLSFIHEVGDIGIVDKGSLW